MALAIKVPCMKAKLLTILRKAMEPLVFKTGLTFRDYFPKASPPMESLSLMRAATMQGILKIFKHQAMVFTRTFRMAIIMRGSGRKICSMDREFRNIPTQTIIKADLCVEASLEKESTNSQMEKSIKDHFTMGIAMGLAN